MDRFTQVSGTLSRAIVLSAMGLALSALQACSKPGDTLQGSPSAAVAESDVPIVPGAPLPPGSGLDARPVNTTCVATVQPKLGLSVSSERIFPNLYFNAPIQLLQAPGDPSRWFIVEQGGMVKVIPASQLEVSSAATFADLRSRAGSAMDTGLLAMAFDPDFATNGRIYVSYVAKSAAAGARESRISRFAASEGTVDAGSETVLLRLPLTSSTRAVGAIAFGPDKMLYAAFGDDSARGQSQLKAQEFSTLYGKLIRIDVSGNESYKIPTDNPYAGAGSASCPTGSTAHGAKCAEIYALGFHSPRGWSFDGRSARPDIWLADSGQDRWEEVNRVSRGGNFGWPIREGARCLDGAAACTTNTSFSAELVEPVAEYPRPTMGRSITGGFVYRGAAIPFLKNRYVFGDFVSGSVFALRSASDGANPVEEILRAGAQISSFAEDSGGELYYVNQSGTLHKLTPGTMKQDLSQTGCVDSKNPKEPAAGLIPYDIAAPFWSDGAVKTRWMALPEGGTIKVEANGDWTFPPGTVLMKNFELNGALIETRLLMRHTDTGNWGGYSYRWNADGSDATLEGNGADVIIGKQTWSYLSVGNCLRCHTALAGESLGLETRQLNRSIVYRATGREANQLSTLMSIGLFANKFTVQDPYPDPRDESRPLEERVRSYLHTNCSQCHRPGSGIPANLDFRFTTPMERRNVCNAPPPLAGSMSIPGERLIVPGDTSRSLLYQRVSHRNRFQMPPLGTHLVDREGAALLKQWIEGMKSGCR
jgi:uncharacterized repeat protein (TIGR03806 family)